MRAKRMKAPQRAQGREAEGTGHRMRRAAGLLPAFLTLLLIAAGFFASGVVGKLLPDYTERITVTRLEQAIQNAFYTGYGDELLVYPWDSFNVENCKQLSQGPGLTGAQVDAARGVQTALQNMGTPFSEIDWGSRILLNSTTGMNYLPETSVDGAASFVSMAFDEGSICYYHLKHEGEREDSFREGEDELIQMELNEAREWLSQGEGAVESEQPDAPDASYGGSNPFIQFLYGFPTIYSGVEQYSGYYFYNQAYSIQQIRRIIQKGDYITLYREGETLISFSLRTNDRYTSSVVLYYDEFYHTISGFSAKV